MINPVFVTSFTIQISMLFVANSTPSSYYVHSISKAHMETNVARFITWIYLIISPDRFS